MTYSDNTPKWMERHNRPVKTVNVREFKNHVNKLLSMPTFTQDQKQALCVLLQDVLFATKQYNGYNFTRWINGGYEEWKKDGEPKDNLPYIGDEFDRYYY